MAIEEITVLIKYLTGGNDGEEATVILDLNLGEFRKEAQEMFGIAKNRNCHLMLEKTNQVLDDSDTFRSAGIQNNAVLLLMPDMGGA